MSPQSHYRIDLPAARWSENLRLLTITTSSAKALRNHVERFARYFLREMGFSGIQFEAAETPQSEGFVPYKAYLFAVKGRYIGAGCFRYRIDQDASVPWLFDFLWLHPYFRHRGYLTRVWPELLKEFDTFGNAQPFRLAQPLSLPMQNFLCKPGWKETR